MTSWWKSRCWVCFNPELLHLNLCHSCIQALKPIVLEHACIKCKAPLPLVETCGVCLQTDWQFMHLESPFYYNPMAKYLLHHLKFYQQLLLMPVLADLLIEHLQAYFVKTPPEVIIPVPLHSWRLLRRGFNQAHELAKRVGKYYQVPVQAHLAKKIKSTQAQARLDFVARQKNLVGSFTVKLQQPLAHVLLIDDVFTSGATVNYVAGELVKAGVERVDVATLFRA